MRCGDEERRRGRGHVGELSALRMCFVQMSNVIPNRKPTIVVVPKRISTWRYWD